MMTKKFQIALEKKAQLFSLFSDPNRLKIMHFLASNDKASVSEVAHMVAMSIACTSHHLQLLKDNQLVTTKRQGNSIYYSLVKDPLIQNLLII